MFMEYRNLLTHEIMGLPLKMADILDASINLNPVTGVQRQWAIEKRALDIYNDSLNRVCKLAGNLMKATRMEELEKRKGAFNRLREKFDEMLQEQRVILGKYQLTMDLI